MTPEERAEARRLVDAATPGPWAYDGEEMTNTSMENGCMKIKIKKSPTADSRTCDWSKVTRDELLAASKQHIDDIKRGFDFFALMLHKQAAMHDLTKLSHIDDFHRNFATGFKETDWWVMHHQMERHHFNAPEYVPTDVNLFDVLDQIVDGVMAGMARSGSYRQEPISEGLLMRAYRNTVSLLLERVEVEP